ncbi:hypothetical protein ACIP4Y_01575 [Streptomyces sp. NPDC088810]|uniref:hypothetical protein n=1 Tax=Streptomyces sp. NPDC088810 TaxID=3365904 RepID=UPI003819B252
MSSAAPGRLHVGDGPLALREARGEPPRAIGWLTGQEKADGRLEFGGWVWRYDLVPLGPSGTEVTLTYDWSAVPRFIRERYPVPAVRS